MLKMAKPQQLELTKQWVEKVVVGLNLCPFAKPVLKADTLHYAITEQSEADQLKSFFLKHLDIIAMANEETIATSLIIFPNALADFYDYLDFVSFCEALITQAGLTAEFQLASFHPNYLFAGVDAQDLSHWSNRSPFPMVHIIREAQMSRVLENHPDPDSIPNRNIALLRELGREELIARFPAFAKYC